MDQEPGPKPPEPSKSPNQTSNQGEQRRSIIQKARDFFSSRNKTNTDLAKQLAAKNQMPDKEMIIPAGTGLGEQIAARNQSPVQENNILAKAEGIKEKNPASEVPVSEDNQIATAIESLQGAPAAPEQVETAKKGIRTRLSKLKVFGQPLQDFLIGGATSSAVKMVARSGLAFAGVSGLPAFAAIGAAGGGATGGVREYLRQRKEINQKDSEQLAQIRRGLKRELHRLKAADKKRVRNAAMRGAAAGAVGGAISTYLIDYVSNNEYIQEKAGKVVNYIREKAVDYAEWSGAKKVGVHDFIQEKGVPAAQDVFDKTKSMADELNERGQEITKKVVGSDSGIRTLMDDKVPGVQEVQAIQAQAIPEAPAVNVPEVKLPETPITQIKPALPHNLESVNLESGSNPWAKVHGYLAENLGREPSNSEIQSAVARVLTENNIQDATRIPAGTELKFSGVNRYVEDLLSGKSFLSPDIAGMPEVVSLPEGSNPWNEVSSYLKDSLGRPVTNAEILEVTKAVAQNSDIEVPDWGINGANLDTQLQPGYKLNFNEDVKNVIQKISDNPQIDITPNNTPQVPAVDSQPVTPPHQPAITETTQPQPVPTPVETPPPTPTDTAAPAQTPTPEAAASQSGIPNELKTFYLAPENRNAQGIKNFVQNYLMFNLGRQVSPEEIIAGIEKVTLGNKISDASSPTKDFELNLAGLNQYIKQLSSK